MSRNITSLGLIVPHSRERSSESVIVRLSYLLVVRLHYDAQCGRNVAICLTMKLLNATAARPLSRRSNFSADTPRLVCTSTLRQTDAPVRATGAWGIRRDGMGWGWAGDGDGDAMRCDAMRCGAPRVSWYLGAQDAAAAAAARTEESYRVKSRLSIRDQPA